MYFPNEVEDNLYLLGIPIPRFLVSIYIYLLDEGSDDFCIQFFDIGDGMNCTFEHLTHGLNEKVNSTF